MSDRDALIAAILAEPDEDTPRLALADWLDENGDADRAEYIRVQVRRARLRFGSAAFAEEEAALLRRVTDLAARQREWVRELGLPPDPQTHFLFRRGLVGCAVMTVEYFVEHGEEVFAKAPVEEIRFRGVTAENIQELSNAPAFARVRAVDFLLDETPTDVLLAFLREAPVSHIRWFTLSTRGIPMGRWGNWQSRKAAVGSALARRVGFRDLRRLRLAHIDLGNETAAALAGADHLGALELLDLRENHVGPETTGLLRAKFGDALCIDLNDALRFTGDQLGWC